MAIPKRMNLVSVKLRRYEKTSTIMDDDFSEPVSQQVLTVGDTVKAQVVYGFQEELIPSYGGDKTKVKGHLTLRRSDIVTSLQKGDRITEIAGESYNYEIDEVRNSGHLRGGPNLIMAFFVEPSERNSI